MRGGREVEDEHVDEVEEGEEEEAVQYLHQHQRREANE